MGHIPLVVVKAVGNACNLCCSYCYAIDAHSNVVRLMSDEILERVITAIAAQSELPICLWSGGEPLLAGRMLLQKALELQRTVADGRQFINSIQTNATLLDNSWINFLLQHKFQVGLSWDGDSDDQRVTLQGTLTRWQVWQTIQECRSQGLLVGVSMVAHRLNYQSVPSDLLKLHEIGVRAVIVKPFRDSQSVTSLKPAEYFDLMCRLLDVWLVVDDSDWKIEPMSSFIAALNGPVANCEFANECHRFLTIEQNGDITGCDFVWPRPVLGNVMRDNLQTIVQSAAYQQWCDRVTAVPKSCLSCRWFRVCGGGCLHYRQLHDETGYWGLYDLCQSRQRVWAYYAEQVAKFGWPR